MGSPHCAQMMRVDDTDTPVVNLSHLRQFTNNPGVALAPLSRCMHIFTVDFPTARDAM
jgi:hypothetical protein